MAAYDEEEVLGRYLVRHLESLMTDFERRCYRLGVMREKVEASPSSRVAERLRSEWPDADKEVREALSDGVTAFRRRFVDRCHWALQNQPLMGASKPATPDGL